MTSANIQQAVCKYLIRPDVVVFTTNMSWHWPFEMDIISVSKTSYLTEYEIKVSRSDFKADFKKSISVHYGSQNRISCVDEVLKHDWYAGISLPDFYEHRKPNRYYFVTPFGMISPDEVPKHAGWIEVSISRDGHFIPTIRKKAPQLHKRKLAYQIILKIARNSCIKYAASLTKQAIQQLKATKNE